MTKQTRSKVLLVSLVFIAVIFPVVPLLDHLGRPELTYPVIAALVAIGLAIRGSWELRGRLWFWITITVIVALHVPLILLVPWKAGWVPARVTTAFGIADLAIIYGVIGFIKKLSEE
jgi:hypothetical protein